MSGYLISIIGVVILGVLVDLVLPSGQMNKFVKSMFGIFTILVIVSPVPKLINSNFDFSSLFYNQASIEVDKDFLEVTNKKIVEQLAKSIVASCENSGYSKVECEIESILVDNKLVIEKVKINLKNLVISQDVVHINKYTEIEQAVQRVVNIEKEQIVFDEWWQKEKKFIFFAVRTIIYKETKKHKTYWNNYCCNIYFDTAFDMF